MDKLRAKKESPHGTEKFSSHAGFLPLLRKNDTFEYGLCAVEMLVILISVSSLSSQDNSVSLSLNWMELEYSHLYVLVDLEAPCWKMWWWILWFACFSRNENRPVFYLSIKNRPVSLVDAGGLEPSTSRVWGERSNQLSYASKKINPRFGGLTLIWWPGRDSNSWTRRERAVS